MSVREAGRHVSSLFAATQRPTQSDVSSVSGLLSGDTLLTWTTLLSGQMKFHPKPLDRLGWSARSYGDPSRERSRRDERKDTCVYGAGRV